MPRDNIPLVEIPTTTSAKLNVAADFIETIPPRKFNIRVFWIEPFSDGCGSIGCAIGHMGQARILGLRPETTQGFLVAENVARQLGITIDEVNKLFFIHRYQLLTALHVEVQPHHVVKRVRRLAKHYARAGN